MAFKNPGDEYSLDEILKNIKKLIETKGLFLIDEHKLDEWISYLMGHVNKKQGRTRIG